jgi:hypothetical protein
MRSLSSRSNDPLAFVADASGLPMVSLSRMVLRCHYASAVGQVKRARSRASPDDPALLEALNVLINYGTGIQQSTRRSVAWRNSV